MQSEPESARTFKTRMTERNSVKETFLTKDRQDKQSAEDIRRREEWQAVKFSKSTARLDESLNEARKTARMLSEACKVKSEEQTKVLLSDTWTQWNKFTVTVPAVAGVLMADMHTKRATAVADAAAHGTEWMLSRWGWHSSGEEWHASGAADVAGAAELSEAANADATVLDAASEAVKGSQAQEAVAEHTTPVLEMAKEKAIEWTKESLEDTVAQEIGQDLMPPLNNLMTYLKQLIDSSDVQEKVHNIVFFHL